MKPVFGIKNSGEKTVTIPLLSYKFYADGQFIGTANYSTEDIPLTGRALLTTGLEVPFTTKVKIKLTEEIENEYMKIANGEDVEYSASGVYTIQTAWQTIDVEFENLSSNWSESEVIHEIRSDG